MISVPQCDRRRNRFVINDSEKDLNLRCEGTLSWRTDGLVNYNR